MFVVSFLNPNFSFRCLLLLINQLKKGVNTDLVVRDLLKAADIDGRMKIAFHLEPYHSRSVESVRDDMEYIINNYGHHSCLYRGLDGRPVFYVYDSYHIYPAQWTRLLSESGDLSIRGTHLDAWVLGLWLHHFHGRDLKDSNFDGIYTYFGTDGFSYGSTSSNWESICEYCERKDMICNLSVGPGYNDTLIRPWNSHNERSRNDGEYYNQMWKRAHQAAPRVVSVTTFNEWGEGTQIEPARPWDPRTDERQYLDYGKDGPFKYIHSTLLHSKKFLSQAKVEL